jgi:hypothetical protein
VHLFLGWRSGIGPEGRKQCCRQALTIKAVAFYRFYAGVSEKMRTLCNSIVIGDWDGRLKALSIDIIPKNLRQPVCVEDEPDVANQTRLF